MDEGRGGREGVGARGLIRRVRGVGGGRAGGDHLALRGALSLSLSPPLAHTHTARPDAQTDTEREREGGIEGWPEERERERGEWGK